MLLACQYGRATRGNQGAHGHDRTAPNLERSRSEDRVPRSSKLVNSDRVTADPTGSF